MSEAMRLIAIEPLRHDAFAPFGDVVDIEGAMPTMINQGFAERFDTPARIDVGEDGAPATAIFIARPRPLPIAITVMERHPRGSQMFLPLQDQSWLIVVCSDPTRAETFRAFHASGRQGINYARNVWHHPLLVLQADARFLVVDRAGPGANLQEHWLAEPDWLYLAP